MKIEPGQRFEELSVAQRGSAHITTTLSRLRLSTFLQARGVTTLTAFRMTFVEVDLGLSDTGAACCLSRLKLREYSACVPNSA